MKRFFVAALCCMAALSVNAQNLQLHYDFGRHIYPEDQTTRQPVTLTFEMFKADRIGNWFMFIDLDMYADGMKGGYTEISREFTFANASEKSSFAAHIEYDGGMTTFKTGGGTRFQNAFLLGPAYNWHSDDFSTTFSVQAMYKQYLRYGNSNPYASFQLTGVWSTTFAAGKCTFSGFIDFWRGENEAHNGKLVVLTEPQFWYNAGKHFSVGTEVEISNNFIIAEPGSTKTFFVNPTLALKYNF